VTEQKRLGTGVEQQIIGQDEPLFPARLVTDQLSSISLRELCHFATPGDAATQTVRLAQLYALIRLVPVTVAANLFNACIVAAALFGSVPTLPLATWLGTMLAFCSVRSLRARRLIHDPAYTQRHPTGIRSVTTGVGVLALLWAVPMICWFPDASEPQRLLIAIVVTGMMSGGAMTMATVPPAAITYIVVLAVAAIATTLIIGEPLIAGLVLAFAIVLSFSALWNARQFVSHLRARLELEEQGQLVRLLREFEASGSDWLWELDADLRLRYMSVAMADVMGHPLRDLLGLSVFALLDPSGKIAEVSAGMRAVMDHFRDGEDFRDMAIPTMGGTRWWALSAKRMIDDKGKVVGWRGVGSDITDTRLRGEDSTRAVRQDPMTGLANRLLVRELIEEALLRQWQGDADCSLLLVDLDRFKLVNDTLGHGVGDQLLIEVARRLEEEVGDDGRVGRLDGDEFAIIWRGRGGHPALSALAQRVIDAIARTYLIGIADLHVGATIGIACGPLDGEREEALIRSADLALYHAKKAGRGGFAFYKREMFEEAEDRRLLENDVRSALQSDSFTLAYQPIVDAITGAVVGREALLRWCHPTRGPIAPDVFIPIVEDAGLIHQIGGWVIREACREAASWAEPLRVAVNVSAAQLGGAGLAQSVIGALADSGLRPNLLELEVTESIFIGDDPATLLSLARLRELGVRLVLDDFGQGYSSFGYLSRAKFAKIKIDQQFVRDAAAGDRDARAIVTAILALAQGLGVESTAEGVETETQAEVMRDLGCGQLQGFYFGRPVPSADIARAPTRRRKRA
jgi:diguanylate cyclase (GGDEF)-like protein/PAS domain S-box-containing protein